MIRVLTPSTGPQLFIAGRRVHHGLTGCLFILLGLALAVHDRKDVKRWL
jgi:hypothetical protein